MNHFARKNEVLSTVNDTDCCAKQNDKFLQADGKRNKEVQHCLHSMLRACTLELTRHWTLCSCVFNIFNLIRLGPTSGCTLPCLNTCVSSSAHQN